METTLRNFGNSVGLVIPKTLRDALHLVAGQTVILEQDNEKLIIKSLPSKKYTLEQLLAQCDVNAPLTEDIIKWEKAPPHGNESW